MIADVAPTTLITLIIGVSTFIIITFLPALLELKRPRDAGPRAMADGGVAAQSQEQVRSLTELEEQVETGQVLARKIADVISVLPDLEA
jgi:hypothetical protein